MCVYSVRAHVSSMGGIINACETVTAVPRILHVCSSGLTTLLCSYSLRQI